VERPVTAPGALDRAIEVVLTAGVVLSGGLLLAGLATGRPALMQAGILILVSTPVARVVVLTAGLLQRRDWTFAAISLVVLGVLGSSAAVSLWIERPRASAVRPGAPGGRP
jgi:uncharacterized membrane protein